MKTLNSFLQSFKTRKTLERANLIYVMSRSFAGFPQEFYETEATIKSILPNVACDAVKDLQSNGYNIKKITDSYTKLPNKYQRVCRESIGHFFMLIKTKFSLLMAVGVYLDGINELDTPIHQIRLHKDRRKFANDFKVWYKRSAQMSDALRRQLTKN